MSLEERLAYYVVEGTKEGLIPDLEQALESIPRPAKYYQRTINGRHEGSRTPV